MDELVTRDVIEEDPKEMLFFPANVQAAISEVFSTDDDPLDAAEFSAIDYINEMFPTEQSLTNLDDTIGEMRGKISVIDDDLRYIVRGHHGNASAGGQVGVEDASVALAEAQSSIVDLFGQIREIKTKAAESEATVRDITRDIKQLDVAKRNLTSAITTLNHLHMLVGGVITLKKQKEDRQYNDAANLLQGLQEVIAHFANYSEIPQVKDLANQVKVIQSELGEQIINDFHKAFAAAESANLPRRQLAEACLVVDVLDPKVKRNLLKFLLNRQLAEYSIVFSEGEECSWLSRIDDRYNWLKRHLLEFEENLGGMFPLGWEMSERIAVEFCRMTCKDLEKTMFKRQREIDTKLLLHAVQRTANFESLLSRKFEGVTINHDEYGKESSTTNPFEEELEKDNPFFEQQQQTSSKVMDIQVPNLTPFFGLISQCFEPYLHIYIESQDQNLIELIDRAAQEQKNKGYANLAVEGSSVLHSCGDLFLCYKKCIKQCTELSTGEPLLALTNVFKKHLKEYASRILIAHLPKLSLGGGQISTSSSAAALSSMTNTLMTRDIKELSTQLQNFHSLLKEGEQIKLHPDERVFICSVIVTAEYIIETTQQLESKLKEKVNKGLVDRINMSAEQDIYHNVISTCLGLLVEELEASCEAPLTSMTKIPWSTIESVGDQSNYVTVIINHMKQTITLIRDNLSNSKKYFTQFCIKFANNFIPKFLQSLYKCRPSTVGAEQLLLDTHSIKTLLLDLPTIGSKIAKERKAPASYTKIVVKGMTRAEMTLKVVMSPSEPLESFVDQFNKLLNDADLLELTKVLEMKGIKKVDHPPFQEYFNASLPLSSASITKDSDRNTVLEEESKIKKLEKMIKKRL